MTNRINKCLVVSAWMPEQELLRTAVKEGNKGKSRLFEEVDFVLTGVGSLKAAAVVAKELQMRPVQRVLFCGTAGAFDGNLLLCSAHVAVSCLFLDGFLLEQRGYLPGFSVSEVVPVDCLSCSSITTDQSIVPVLQNWGKFENLELAGVAEACSLHGVSWAAYLGVSNHVGLHAHEQWKRHHQEASCAAQRLLLKEEFREE